MKCSYEGCESSAIHCIEWWGLNQEGEDPEIRSERYSCQDPEHLVTLSKHEEYGGYPDEIYRLEDIEEKPLDGLLKQVKKCIDNNSFNLECLTPTLLGINSDQRQQLLF